VWAASLRHCLLLSLNPLPGNSVETGDWQLENVGDFVKFA
jgi:hypothetical protein